MKLLANYLDIPGAIPRVREAIWKLAIQGKIAHQHSSDGSADSDLLIIQMERSKKHESGGIKQKNSMAIDHKEFPFDVPTSWKWIRLASICRPQAGFAFPSSAFTDLQRGLPIIRIRDISNDRTQAYYQGEYRPEFLVNTGDYLVGMDGNFNVAKWRGPKALLNQRVSRLQWFSDDISHSFFAQALQYQLWNLQGTKAYTTVDHLSTKQIENALIPFPPLAEQKRIVAKVEELMAVCDRLEAQQRERDTRHAALARAALARFAAAPTLDNLQYLFHPAYDIAPDELRKSILRMAVNGTLIPFAPQPGSRVSDHYDFINGYAFKSEWFRESGVRLCRNINVGHGSLNWHELACLDIDRASEYNRFSLGVGDIVLSLDRPIISTGLKVARIRPDDLPCLLLQRVAKPTPKHSDLSLDYFYLWLNSPCFMDAIDPGRSNGVPHISTREVLGLSLNMPPLDVQKDIVATVHRLMSLVDRYESQLATASNTATRLLDALVAELTGTVRSSAFTKPDRTPHRAPLHNALPESAGREPGPDANEPAFTREATSAIRTGVRHSHGEIKDDDLTRLLILLRKSRSLTSGEAQVATGLDPTVLRNLFKTLINQGLVYTEGQRRGMRYHIMNNGVSTENKLMNKIESPTGFSLRRFAMSSGYRSLDAFDLVLQPIENVKEPSPVVLVGLNGSGKSNLIEALVDSLCYVELFNVPWDIPQKYRSNRHRFEIEYDITINDVKFKVKIVKNKQAGLEMTTEDGDGKTREVERGESQLSYLPSHIAGYSSGLNETLSHPFYRTKALYSDEVYSAAKITEKRSIPYPSRTYFMDYEMNSAILITNDIFGDNEFKKMIANNTRVDGVCTFDITFRAKRPGSKGDILLTDELTNIVESFAKCAQIQNFSFSDEAVFSYDFRNHITRSLFLEHFKTADRLFSSLYKWSLLNALALDGEQRKIYLKDDITAGALDRAPTIRPKDRAFDISNLKLAVSGLKKEMDYSGLSDGEHQFVQVFGTVALFSDGASLFVFDEPESHFNPEWRHRFNKILSSLPHSERHSYIITTHSPFIVSGVKSDKVIRFKRNANSIECLPVRDFETYGAPFELILRKLFDMDTTIDRLVKEKINDALISGNISEVNAKILEVAESPEKIKLYQAHIDLSKK